MKQKKWQKNLLFTLGLFTLLTAAAALLDDGWWAKTTESAGSMTGWALGGLFGAALLLYLIKGAAALYRILIVRFLVMRGEQILLLGLFLGGVAFFAADGLIDSSAGLGAALLLGALLALGLFWLWRRAHGIVRRLADGGRYENLNNLEYFLILGVSAVLAFVFLGQEPGMFERENIGFLALAEFLLLLVIAILGYWAYVGIKTLLRLHKLPKEAYALEKDALVFCGAVRTLRIPLEQIERYERQTTYAGLSGIPTLLVRAHTSELLALRLTDGKTTIRLPLPEEEFLGELRDRAGAAWAADKQESGEENGN